MAVIYPNPGDTSYWPCDKCGGTGWCCPTTTATEFVVTFWDSSVLERAIEQAAAAAVVAGQEAEKEELPEEPEKQFDKILPERLCARHEAADVTPRSRSPPAKRRLRRRQRNPMDDIHEQLRKVSQENEILRKQLMFQTGCNEEDILELLSRGKAVLNRRMGQALRLRFAAEGFRESVLAAGRSDN